MSSASSDAPNDILTIMRRLRDPETGCPWDVAQDFRSIAPYTIEEAYEVADAIERGDFEHLCSELGDLLFQVAFHAQMAEEAGIFTFADVERAIVEKMVRRHPHVFGQEQVRNAEEQTLAWEQHKARERDEDGHGKTSGMDAVTRGLPALQRARGLQKAAANAGFDWPDAASVAPKIVEELDELMAARAAGLGAEKLREEFGDLLFACVNLGRHLGVEPESALLGANQKFERRYRAMEQHANDQGTAFAGLPAAAQEALWQAVKRAQADGTAADGSAARFES